MRCGGGSGRHERAIHDHLSTLRAPGGGDTARIPENFSGDRSWCRGSLRGAPCRRGRRPRRPVRPRSRRRRARDSGRPGRRYVIRGGAVMSMDPTASGDFAQGRRAGRGQEDPRRRAEPARGRRGGDRRARQHRHARLHRHAPPPVRDGAAQLPRRRDADQRRLGLAEREHDLLRIHPADVRPGVPAAGRVHQRAVRRAEPARRRRHDGARRLADPSLARSTPTPPSRRCSIPGAAPPSAISRARAPRYRHQSRQPVSERRDPHQEAVVLLERPARPHDHGRRGLSRGSDAPTQSWTIGRQLGLQIAAHILSPFGIRPIFDELAAGHGRQRQHRASGRTTCSST